MSAEGVTPGPWNARRMRHHTEIVSAGPRGRRVCMVHRCREVTGVIDSEADARLIAEAGTVLHETGKTPRQLADALAEVERLMREREAIRNCALKYLGYLGLDGPEKALEKDLTNSEMTSPAGTAP